MKARLKTLEVLLREYPNASKQGDSYYCEDKWNDSITGDMVGYLGSTIELVKESFKGNYYKKGGSKYKGVGEYCYWWDTRWFEWIGENPIFIPEEFWVIK